MLLEDHPSVFAFNAVKTTRQRCRLGESIVIAVEPPAPTAVENTAPIQTTLSVADSAGGTRHTAYLSKSNSPNTKS